MNDYTIGMALYTNPNTQGHLVITGATGFLGIPAVHALLQKGYSVTALVRNPQVAKKSLPSEVRIEKWDGISPPNPSLLHGAYAIIHLAGETLAHWPWNAARKKILRDSRILSTQALVTAMKSAAKPPHCFIMASGMGYHGNAGTTPVSEASGPGQDFLSGMAADWEAAAAPAKELSVRPVALRFGMILAPQGGALAPLKRVYRLGLGAYLGSGKQGHPWIHRDDAISLLLHSLSHTEIQGPVHACSPTTPSQGEFAKALGKAVQRPVWPWTPAIAIRLALGEFSDLLLHGQYGQPLKAQASGFEWKFPQLDKALNACIS
jgi:uncharacterized protein